MEIGWGPLLLYVMVGLLALLSIGLNPRWILMLLVLVMPFGNFDLEGPVTFGLSKLVLVLFIVTLPAQYAVSRALGRKIRFPLSLSLFFLVVVVSTLGSFVWTSGLSAEGFDLLRGPGFRPIVQLGSLCLRASALVGVLLWASDTASWPKLCKGMLLASTVIAAYAVYQFIGYYNGWPIVGIHRAQVDMTGGYGLFQIGSLRVFRAGSLTGEPKEAAKFLLPSIVLIVFAKSTTITGLQSRLTSLPILILHVVAFLLTFATSSFFGLVITLPFTLYLLSQVGERLNSVRLLIAATVVCITIGGIVVMGGGGETASQIYAARIAQRVGDIDSPEQAAIQFLRNHPLYLVTGIGLGNSSFVLRPYFDPAYYRPLTVSLNSGYLQIVLEGGLPALLTFLLFLGSWFLRGIRSVATEQAGERRGMLVTTLAVCLVLAAVNAFSGTEAQIWIFWGLLIALCQTPTKHNSLGGLTSARNDNSPARAIRGYSPSLTGPVSSVRN